MKVLIVYAHAEPQSFCASLKNTCVDILTAKGCQVKVSDLYKMNYFNPLGKEDFTSVDPTYFKPQSEQLKSNQDNFSHYSDETKEEHNKLKWADYVLLVFPLYWFHLPGILKNWVDRTFSMGFAYGQGKILKDGPLKGKKGMLIFTTGAPSNMLDGNNLRQTVFFQLNMAIFQFCGITPLEPYVAYAAAHVGDEQRKKYLLEFSAAISTLDIRAEYVPIAPNSVAPPTATVSAPTTASVPTTVSVPKVCTPSNECKVKLTYFNMPGRGEQIRCLLKHAKLPFEDNRIGFDKWGAEKKSGKFEYEQLPALEWNGKTLAQTPAIMMFLAQKLNYLPADPLMQYEANSVYTAVVDVWNTYTMWAFSEKNEDAKTAKKQDYFGVFVPFMFGKFEERLKKQANKKVIVGQSLTYPDFAFAGFSRATFLSEGEAGLYKPIYEKTPLLKAYLDNLQTIC